MSDAREALPALDNSMGALLIGVLLAGSLWGVSCMQTYEYFTISSADHLQIKLMVFTVFCLDTFHQILFSHLIYTYLVTEYSNPAYLNVVTWSLTAQVLVSALIGLIVQCFFCWRVWILSHKNKPIVATIMCFVLTEFVLTTVYFVEGWSIRTFTKLPEVKNLSISVNVVAAAGDILIAGTLIFLLHRSKTGFSGSDSVLNHLILFSLNTGLLTSICALFSLIAITAWSHTLIFITFYAPLSRLYTNSLLATLNARKRIRKRLTNSNQGAISFEPVTLTNASQQRKKAPQSSTGNNLAVQIETETAWAYDSTLGGAPSKLASSKGRDHEMALFNGEHSTDSA